MGVLGMGGAMGLISWEFLKMKQKWQYYDRFYPEATELQKTLQREAQIYKEEAYKPISTQDRAMLVHDIETKKMYKSMYQLPIQRYSDPDDDVNAGEYDDAAVAS